MEVIAYYRVSTDDQASSGLGLDAQRAAVHAAAAARGWSIAAEHTDAARSGGDMNRPALRAALDHLDSAGGVLMVAKLDRLSRSVLDFARIADRARSKRWAVVALDVDVDTTTPGGELVANITASVAQWERRIIGARTSDALQRKKAAGCRLGRPVTLEAAVRDRIAAEHRAGEGLTAIARRLNADNVPTARGGTWYPSTVAAVLRSLDLDAEADRARAASAA